MCVEFFFLIKNLFAVRFLLEHQTQFLLFPNHPYSYFAHSFLYPPTGSSIARHYRRNHSLVYAGHQEETNPHRWIIRVVSVTNRYPSYWRWVYLACRQERDGLSKREVCRKKLGGVWKGMGGGLTNNKNCVKNFSLHSFSVGNFMLKATNGKKIML